MKNIVSKKFVSLVFTMLAVSLLAAGCHKSNSQSSTQTSVNTHLASPTTIPVTPTPTPTQIVGGLTVKQVVDGSSNNQPSYQVVKGKAALELLISTHQVATKVYSGIGAMVTGIDGVAADSKHFWEFFVNGKSSNVGAGSYTLKNGDSIEWKLSEIK